MVTFTSTAGVSEYFEVHFHSFVEIDTKCCLVKLSTVDFCHKANEIAFGLWGSKCIIFLVENNVRNINNLLSRVCDYRLGSGLDIGFIAPFNTHLVILVNYSAIADLHPLQITTAPTKCFPGLSAFTSSCLVTVSTIAIPLLPCSSPF
jgi:hypothetical protein